MMHSTVEPVVARSRTSSVRLALLSGLVGGTLGALVAGRSVWGIHLALAGVALTCFVVLIVLETRRRWLTASSVAVLAALLISFALWFPPRESADVWSYVMYGRIVLHGDDPYTTPPSRFPNDRWLRLVRPLWRNTPSLYGPLFNLSAAGVVRLADGSALGARLGFQVLAALAVAGTMVLLWRRCRDPAAVALVGLNPLVIIGVVNGGHNDALVALFVLAGVLLAERNRGLATGVALGLAALVKVVALLPAGMILLWIWRRRGIRESAGSGVVTVATAAAGYLAIEGVGAWHALEAEAGLTTRFSAWRVVTFVHPVPEAAPSHYLRLAPGGTLGWLPLGIILVLALMGSVAALREESPLHAVALASMVYLLGGLYVSPWYVVWALPLLALAWPSGLAWVVLGLQAALTTAYALALHRHFGPVASLFRVGYFDVVATAQAAAVLALAWAGLRSIRTPTHAFLRMGGGPALPGRPTRVAAPAGSTTGSPPSSRSRPSARRSGW
jgi:glycosyl transferase family 87